jgi:hypothetical protein
VVGRRRHEHPVRGTARDRLEVVRQRLVDGGREAGPILVEPRDPRPAAIVVHADNLCPVPIVDQIRQVRVRMRRKQLANCHPFRIETVEGDRLATHIRSHDERAVSIELDRDDRRVAQSVLADQPPFRIGRGTPPAPVDETGLLRRDRGTYDALTIRDPVGRISGPRVRQQRFPTVTRVEPVHVPPTLAPLVRQHQDVIAAVVEQARELCPAIDELATLDLRLDGRSQHAEIRPVHVDGEQPTTALLAEPRLQVPDIEDQTAVYPLKCADVVAVDRRDHPRLSGLEFDSNQRLASVHRCECREELARRRKLRPLQISVPEIGLRRHGCIGGAHRARERNKPRCDHHCEPTCDQHC